MQPRCPIAPCRLPRRPFSPRESKKIVGARTDSLLRGRAPDVPAVVARDQDLPLQVHEVDSRGHHFARAAGGPQERGQKRGRSVDWDLGGMWCGKDSRQDCGPRTTARLWRDCTRMLRPHRRMGERGAREGRGKTCSVLECFFGQKYYIALSTRALAAACTPPPPLGPRHSSATMAARGGGAPAAGAKDATKDRCDACSWGRPPSVGTGVVAATVRGTGAVWARRTGPSALSLRPRERNRCAGRTPPLQSPRLTGTESRAVLTGPRIPTSFPPSRAASPSSSSTPSTGRSCPSRSLSRPCSECGAGEAAVVATQLAQSPVEALISPPLFPPSTTPTL
jgi:hypothetical protein